ncbi:MAG: hypothetical protein COX30_00965 [Candidatus Moranbacteria bacterium CG23_combo_of_CG06-09_8_20_14_all_39_10]|nr:MAG: hypothetical protein COX30_00965 [Candidatus Moranbacteria bacterium CG23_combo_of_CG06-09_8_20_14_all_39_10]
MKKRIVVIAIAVVISLIIGVVVVFLKNKNNPPLLTVNFIDLDKVEKISKFRSCQGHTVVPQDGSESARNMKHYVLLKPEYLDKQKIGILSPLDGFVQGTMSNPEKGLEGEIWIGQEGTPWAVSFEHIELVRNFERGDKVRAGELIGYVPGKGVDVVYAIGGDGVKIMDGYASPFAALDSVFNHMSEEVFAIYQKKGIKSKDDLIYSREYRDQNACQYRKNDNAGGLNDLNSPQDWVKFD